jgi:hypothetical protein
MLRRVRWSIESDPSTILTAAPAWSVGVMGQRDGARDGSA